MSAGDRFDSGLYYEQFRVGSVITTRPRVITAAEIAAFAELTGDDNPLHTDPAYARAAGFSNVIAHGLFLHSVAMGQIAKTGLMTGTTIALLAASSEFVHPAVGGDEINTTLTITRKRPTRSPARGVLWRTARLANQHDQTLARLRMTALVKRMGDNHDV